MCSYWAQTRTSTPAVHAVHLAPSLLHALRSALTPLRARPLLFSSALATPERVSVTSRSSTLLQALLLIVSPDVAHVEPRQVGAKMRQTTNFGRNDGGEPLSMHQPGRGGNRPHVGASARHPFNRACISPCSKPNQPRAGVPNISTYINGGAKFEGRRACASDRTCAIIARQLSPAPCCCASTTVLSRSMVGQRSTGHAPTRIATLLNC